MTRLLLAACAAALVTAAPANAARFAVGISGERPFDEVVAAVERASGARADRSLAKLGAVVVESRSAGALRRVPGVEYVERADATRRLAFVPNDPLAVRQWHLDPVHAFDFWLELPALAGPRIAVIDSGIDGTHPEFAGKIAAHRSFVGGSALTDTQGHGTLVAGLIAAQTNNGVGVAGMAFGSQLLVAKVVRGNRSVSLEAEAEAIRWAVDNGARVINLSLGGLRDPRNADRDTFSPLEADAIKYAYARGVVVVAAAGNADQAPTTPWPYASYPAALPHVLGVGALSKEGNVPPFSNRDPVFVDIAAPGQELTSTFPRNLTVTAAVLCRAGLHALRERRLPPGRGDVVRRPPGERGRRADAEHAAQPPPGPGDELAHAHRRRPVVRDRLPPLPGRPRPAHGLGTAARRARDLGDARPAGTRPLRDERRRRARVVPALGQAARARGDAGLLGRPERRLRVYLRKGQRLRASLDGPFRADSNLVLWSPAARHLEQFSLKTLQQRLVASSKRGWRQKVSYRARRTGWHYLQAKVVTANAGPYRLRTRRSRAGLSSSSGGTSRSTRAGLPTTTTRGGTSFVTTAPAPTNASSPISIPGQSTAPPPTRAPRRIVGPLTSSWRFSVRPMKLSFVVTTQGAMKTSSSSVEYAVMYASAWIFVSAPIVVSFSTSEPLPMTTSSPTTQRSRTRAPSPTITRAPSFVPAKTIAPVETIVPSPSSSGAERLALRGRAGRERRLFPDDRVVEDLAALAEDGPRVDDRSVRRRACTSGAHAGTAASEFWSCSSVRTTPRPSRATTRRSPSPRTSARKCWHSSLSGSSFGIFGLWMSPLRVIHSP